MSSLPHPYRYPEAFRGQLARLERLRPGVTRRDDGAAALNHFLQIELTGMDHKELVRRNGQLRHLENLIADWRIDGEIIHRVSLDQNADGSPGGSISFPDIPPTVTYLDFDYSRRLLLGAQPRSRIEGVYLREVAARGEFAVELTFVCLEPAWITMDSCLYADAVTTGSRISVGTIPLGKELNTGMIRSAFEGDALVLNDNALLHAVNATADYSVSGRWRAPASIEQFASPRL